MNIASGARDARGAQRPRLRDPRPGAPHVHAGPALVATGFAALEQHRAIDAAIEQAELLAAELDREVGLTAVAGRDVIFLARRGPEPLAASIGYPGDRTPLLAPIGAVFMAWADDAAVDEWLAAPSLDGEAAESYRRVLTDIRARGFSVPMRPLGGPEMADAISPPARRSRRTRRRAAPRRRAAAPARVAAALR